MTHKLPAADIDTLYPAIRAVLVEWTDRLRSEAAGEFPKNVTAFRPEMAVHGKFQKPCPVCGTKVERIVYAENEVNYSERSASTLPSVWQRAQ